MPFLGLLILLVGAYLLDSSIQNRPPLGTLKALIADPSDLAGTLARLKGTWTTMVSGGVTGASVGGTVGSNVNGAAESGASGNLPDSALQSLTFASGKKLIPSAANALEKLNTQYRARFGVNMTVTDGYRSFAQQVKTKAAKGALAAVPGKSVHGWGRAVDLGGGMTSYTSDQYLWMKANAGKFGWIHPAWAEPNGSKHEPWHWEYNG